MGIIDEITDPKDVINNAKEWINNAEKNDLIKPWDQKGFKFPGGAPYNPNGFMSFVGASALVNGKTKGLYFAAKSLLSAVYEGALVDFDTALKIETRWFTKVLLTQECTNMTRSLFLNKEALEKGMSRPKDVKKTELKELTVIGAGMMGSGIAYIAALNGIDVVLIDRDKATTEKGKQYISNILEDNVKKKRMDLNRMEFILSKIKTSTDYADLSNSELIIEAVFEDLQLKKDIYRKIEPHLKPGATLASNTSTLPITELSEAISDTGRFIGIHFFSPVEKMNLVEIIKGRKSSTKSLAVALDFTRMIKKTPIVVNDSRGFYANRCIIPYINEGLQMVSEGISPALVENCAKQIGMPLGPLQLIDELSLNLAVSVANETKEAMGTEYQETGATSMLMEMFQKRRLGRKKWSRFL
jgi:3-hydroxyacyl-CoA dehydrogenase/enoyl-CoA hydratase/3-hydroxybutyryl-CoA epimerase